MSNRTSGWTVAHLAGAPVILTPMWFVAAAVLTALYAPSVSSGAPQLSGVGVALVSLAFVLLLLGSVFLHEAAHALVARARGMKVNELVLTIWGGHTAFTGPGTSKASTALIAFVGPATNLLLAGGFFLLSQATSAGSIGNLLAYAAFWANGFVGIFNLLPGLPLDGGQLLESAVWAATGSRDRGTVAAAWIGRAVAVGLALWAVALPLMRGATPNITTVLWSLMIASMLWTGASAALTKSRRRAQMADLTVDQALVPATTVPEGLNLGQISLTQAPQIVVRSDGHPVGYLDPQAAAAVPAQFRDSTPVSSVLIGFGAAQPIDAALTGTELLQRIAANNRDSARFLPVKRGNQIVGLLDVAAVAQSLSRH